MPHIYKNNLTKYARKNRHAGILAEALLWNELKQSKLGVRFTKQKPIGNYIADFYCAKYNLVIKIDGDSHAEKQIYDKIRDGYMKNRGITVLRFFDTDILKNMSGVLYEILRTLPVTCGATPP